jgi:preprotein translocase subunit SecD
MNFKLLFRSWKIWLLIFALLFAVISLHPNPWASGVAIRSVVKDSSASLAGISTPLPATPPMGREVITAINNVPITNVADYNNFVSQLLPNSTITIKTNKNLYRVDAKSKYEIITLNETESQNYTEEFYNITTNATINITKSKLVNKTIQKDLGIVDLGLKVYDAPTNNIREGLDLQGGTRVLLKPETQMNATDVDTLIENMKERLNVYGLSDIVVKATSDLSGQTFILVEIAGASDQEVKELISKQGKFEAKIGNNTVFKGGEDIKRVCKTAECSYIERCQPASSGYACRFNFAITISTEAAARQAEYTKNLSVVVENGEPFLTENIDLYLDDALFDSLRIGESLKGRATTDISISGSGVGPTEQDALLDAQKNMKRLQTVLITGSLPVKLDIVKTDNISPTLGNEFVHNTLIVGLIAMILVISAIIIRYKRLVVSIPVAITLISELIILLGAAALIGWNIDLIAIAAIIIAIGTGVDSQLVIIDELSGKHPGHLVNLGWKDKIKNALFIVMASYFTLVVAMVPLMFAGAGLLKGFAITTILGASIGVFITRPAFAVIAENLLKHKDE